MSRGPLAPAGPPPEPAPFAVASFLPPGFPGPPRGRPPCYVVPGHCGPIPGTPGTPGTLLLLCLHPRSPVAHAGASPEVPLQPVWKEGCAGESELAVRGAAARDPSGSASRAVRGLMRYQVKLIPRKPPPPVAGKESSVNPGLQVPSFNAKKGKSLIFP